MKPITKEIAQIAGEDFLNSPVPQTSRVSFGVPLLMWTGFIIVVGIMGVGGGLAGQLSERQFIASVLLGSLILSLFAALAGWIGAESGRNFNQLLSDAFPGISWRFASLYLPVILIGWFGVESAIFGKVVGEALKVPVGLQWTLMSGVTLIFATTSYLGFRAIGRATFFLVPIIVVLATVAVVLNFNPDANFGQSEYSISVNQATFIVTSAWITGALACVPDITRFCRTPLQGALVAGVGAFFANTFCFVIGGYAAVSVGEHDPAKLLVSLGMVPLAVLFALANIWSTNDNNMYSAGINFARMASITRKKAVVTCAVLAAIFAAFDPTSIENLFLFLEAMGKTAPALGGLVLGVYLTTQWFPSRELRATMAWISWVAGTVIGFLIEGTWSVVLSFLGAWISWTILYLSTDRKAGSC